MLLTFVKKESKNILSINIKIHESVPYTDRQVQKLKPYTFVQHLISDVRIFKCLNNYKNVKFCGIYIICLEDKETCSNDYKLFMSLLFRKEKVLRFFSVLAFLSFLQREESTAGRTALEYGLWNCFRENLASGILVSMI